jgi:transcription elongation factor Elf1
LKGAATLHVQSSTQESLMPEDFACPNCGSPAIVYIEADKDDGRVVCRRCGTFLMTRGQFRRFVAAPTLLSDVHTTGC